MKPNLECQLLFAAIPMAGFAFAANLIWATGTGNGNRVADGIAGTGNFTLGSLSMVILFSALGVSGFMAVLRAPRQKPTSGNHKV